MAAKGATVERRHRAAAAEVFNPGASCNGSMMAAWAESGEGDFTVVARMAQALAAAEQAATERAWDEGHTAGKEQEKQETFFAWRGHRIPETKNPYHKGDE